MITRTESPRSSSQYPADARLGLIVETERLAKQTQRLSLVAALAQKQEAEEMAGSERARYVRGKAPDRQGFGDSWETSLAQINAFASEIATTAWMVDRLLFWCRDALRVSSEAAADMTLSALVQQTHHRLQIFGLPVVAERYARALRARALTTTWPASSSADIFYRMLRACEEHGAQTEYARFVTMPAIRLPAELEGALERAHESLGLRDVDAQQRSVR